MNGIRIGHRTLRSCVALVPILKKPFAGDSIKQCPNCKVIHPVKTVHLWLDDAGSCIVSEGVLADLKSAGMPDLEILAEVKRPPTLNLGRMARPEVDHKNRKITWWEATSAVA